MNRKEFLEKWCHELETTTIPQIKAWYGTPETGVCAMGLADIVVLQGDAMGEGLITYTEWDAVVQWNDEGFTFPQIAQKVRKEFK